MIELLVVIAIIAILASLLLPTLQQAKERGRTALCTNEMKQLGLSMQIYVDDYDGTFPPTWTNDPPARYWYTDGANYFTGQDAQCPSQQTVYMGYGYSSWICWGVTTARKISAIPKPDAMLLFSEIGPPGVSNGWPWGLVGADLRGEPEARHNRGCNIDFIDGHVDYFPNAYGDRRFHSPSPGSYTGTLWYTP
ncbi:MAG: hypothetical protein A3K19_22075 [Lentisphaerae bacterium RIFOXYB12_FULL_65_16]|nr:MAG: hypothetical protein A3K18_24545 [Lentisphaerae bacterium RIFOXYA12_64_32]OGV93549.1 MAG: hypothetical protein A3K19_22075 [Lentisphaerae bacterium RIFOXYB12_FULL_65_16]